MLKFPAFLEYVADMGSTLVNEPVRLEKRCQRHTNTVACPDSTQTLRRSEVVKFARDKVYFCCIKNVKGKPY